MKPSRLLALLVLHLLCANYVPPSTKHQLTAKSDIVLIARVIAVGLAPPAAAPVSAPCVAVTVEQLLKGGVPDHFIVCASLIAELNPKPPQLGKRYTMFLRRAGTAYVATSWDGIRVLPST